MNKTNMIKTSYITSFTYFHFDIANEQWAVNAIKGGIAEWDKRHVYVSNKDRMRGVTWSSFWEVGREKDFLYC